MVTGIFRGLHNIDVCTNDPHADGAGDTTDKKKLPPSELIDKEQQPHERHEGLDHTEDTGQDVDCVGLHTDALQGEGQYTISFGLGPSGPCKSEGNLH
jgi:hypothetical protein